MREINKNSLKKISILQATIFIISALIFSSGCASIDPVTGKRTMNYYKIDEDVALGQSCLESNIEKMKKQNVPVNQDKKMVKNLETIMKQLTAVCDLPDLPYSITLFQCDIVNAAAAPGGSIMVYSGLYDKKNGLVKNNKELAAVLAHEIAHVTCRHSTEQLSKAKTTSVVGNVLSAGVSIVTTRITGDSNVGDASSDLFSAAYNVGANIWFPSYSRKQEYEADAVSMMYLAKAGIDPRSALEIWKRAAQGSKDEKTSIYASHPTDEDRFNNLQELLPEALKIYEEKGSKGNKVGMIDAF